MSNIVWFQRSIGSRTVSAGEALTAEFAAAPGTDVVASHWTEGRPAGLRSGDGSRALALLRFPGEPEDADRIEAVEAFLDEFDGREAGVAGGDDGEGVVLG